MSLLQVHGVDDMENRLKYEDNKNYSGLGNYDNKVSSLASKHRIAKKELKAALDASDEDYTKSEIKKLEKMVKLTQDNLTAYISSISKKFKKSKTQLSYFEPVSKEYYEI